MMNQGSHYNKNSSTRTKFNFNKNTLRKHISRSILECFLATEGFLAHMPVVYLKTSFLIKKFFNIYWRPIILDVLICQGQNIQCANQSRYTKVVLFHIIDLLLDWTHADPNRINYIFFNFNITKNKF